MKNNYSPDILNCLANLSSDEVFTSPELANRMLDLLPPELFRSSKTRFLDPCSKSGVFLREIAKRLLTGLEEQIPDLQQRIDHIMTKQVFGIACTDLTAEMSRRTLYCTKQANGEYSVSTAFSDAQGNLRYSRCQHTWENGKCKHCGANRSQYDRVESIETYAYPFIHKSIKEILKKDMQFDVIIGNPPYQMGDGGNGASALPVYHKFIEQTIELQPKYMIFIVPARWLNGGRGLDEFRKKMLEDSRIRVLHDYLNSTDCFSGVEIKGGICYFLWEKDYNGICSVYTHNQDNVFHSRRPLLENGAEVFIRSEEQVSIFHKVLAKQEESLSKWLNAGRYFGFHTKVEWVSEKEGKIQSADGKVFYPIRKDRNDIYSTKVYVHGGQCWISPKTIPRNANRISSYKVLIPRSGNPGFGNTIIGKPKISEPNTCSSNTYMVAIPPQGDMSINEATNLCSYLNTKFVRLLVATKTSTQSTPPDAFEFVPLQDFSHPWTDEMLYKKYNLDKDEIAFIESMIRPME